MSADRPCSRAIRRAPPSAHRRRRHRPLALVLGLAGFAGLFHDGVRERALDGAYAKMLEELGFADREALRDPP